MHSCVHKGGAETVLREQATSPRPPAATAKKRLAHRPYVIPKLSPIRIQKRAGRWARLTISSQFLSPGLERRRWCNCKASHDRSPASAAALARGLQRSRDDTLHSRRQRHQPTPTDIWIVFPGLHAALASFCVPLPNSVQHHDNLDELLDLDSDQKISSSAAIDFFAQLAAARRWGTSQRRRSRVTTILRYISRLSFQIAATVTAPYTRTSNSWKEAGLMPTLLTATRVRVYIQITKSSMYIVLKEAFPPFLSIFSNEWSICYPSHKRCGD